jgi:hypothetical protein
VPREQGERLIRCLHTDRTRPPHTDDPHEFHWRCTAIFQCDEGTPPYCPHHRPLYHHGPTATSREVKQAVEAWGRLVEHVTMPGPRESWLFPGTDEDKELESEERLAAARATKAKLKAQAEQLQEGEVLP